MPTERKTLLAYFIVYGIQLVQLSYQYIKKWNKS